jgi:mRNA-degrading endonuclease RelE of RelBE toxin-antitoxin system
VDRLKKFLAKLDRKRWERVVGTIESIEKGEIEHLDIKPLSGMSGHYRCRIGNIRILFRGHAGNYTAYEADFRGNIYKK